MNLRLKGVSTLLQEPRQGRDAITEKKGTDPFQENTYE